MRRMPAPLALTPALSQREREQNRRHGGQRTNALAQWLQAVPLYPQVLINVRLAPSQDWKNNKLLDETLQAVQAELGDTGRVLIRPSGTEPLLRVMVEARDQQQASRGSSVLVDNIRWQSYLSSMTSAEAEEWGVDDDQRRFFVRFGVSKANYGAPFADRWFRRHDGGVLKPAVLERQRKSKGVPRGEA